MSRDALLADRQTKSHGFAAHAAPTCAATVLVAGAIQPQHGRHDLCLKFAQHGIDPMRTLDWVQLIEIAPATEAR